MIAPVRNWFVSSPLGICALGALLASSGVIFALAPRYCFATDSSWVAKDTHTAALILFLSVAAAPFGLWLDRRKLYAAIALLACLPLLYILSISAGCF